VIVKRYAAIDIGSNAVRLLINTIIETENQPPQFKKTSLVRVPIRLGEDVFVEGNISMENAKRMKETLKAFTLLMQAHKVDKYKACATSAMREASNNKLITSEIEQETGIEVDIIEGEEEAAIIAKTDLRNLIHSERTYLYVDVGGGSTEFTLFSHGKTITSKSFPLGTVRILNNMIQSKVWKEAEAWVEKKTSKYKTVRMIGSGGNINHIFKQSERKRGKPLTFTFLNSYFQKLKELSYEERVIDLEMNLDRADVIIPAAEIFISAMQWSGARKIYVPKIGLADGIIKSMYNDQIDKKDFE